MLSSIAATNRKKAILVPQQERRRFSPCLATALPKRGRHNTASEKPPLPKLSLFSNGLLTGSSLSQFPLLSIKYCSFPLASGLALWFCHSLHVPNCNSSAIPKQTHFAAKQTNKQKDWLVRFQGQETSSLSPDVEAMGLIA